MAYRIKKLATVSSEENLQIRNLVEICNRYDRTNYSYFADDSSANENEINTLLIYNAKTLISVISLFTLRSCEAEVLAFTHPDYRRMGFFKTLLSESKAELRVRNISDFMFVCDNRAEISQKVMDHLGAKYQFTEYSMQLNWKKFTPFSLQPGIEIRASIMEDKNELIRINSEAFDETLSVSEEFVNGFLESGRRPFHTILFNGMIVGMIGIYIEDTKYYVHGVSIDKRFRGQGIGAQALSFIILKYRDINPAMAITLDVNSMNKSAVKLYIRTGFERSAEFEYFMLPLSTFHETR